MASAFAHAIASVAIGKASFIQRVDWKFWLLGIFCAVVPDADALGYKLGVPYESVWGHRGITHSFS
jgi:inner membrane protein